MTKNKINYFLLASVILTCIWSAISPKDYFVWFLETFPIAIGFIAIFSLRETFPFSDFLFRVIMIHMMILAVGGHYTYAEVPLFNNIRDAFGASRNEFDKVGHFFQGITPALLIREIILRKTDLKNNKMIFTFCVSCALAFSALYEIFEWIIAVATGEGADFVSMQGDIWDAQKDMLTAFLGAIFILVFFRKIHDKSLTKIQ